MQTDKQTIFLDSLFKPYYSIEKMDDVREFLKGLIYSVGLGMGFHRDTPFDDYEGLELTQLQIEKLEGCMGTAMEICEGNGVDIYELSLKMTHVAYLEKYIADWEEMEALENNSPKNMIETMLIDKLYDFQTDFGYPIEAAEETLAQLEEDIENL